MLSGHQVLAPFVGSAPFRAALKPFRQGPTILLYHGVAEHLTAPWIQQLHMPFDVFERQIAHLQRHYEVVPLEVIADALNSGTPLDPSWTVLTFDDGYRNISETVAPYLASLGLPFTVFISTHHVETGERFPTYITRVATTYTRLQRVEISTIGRTFELGTLEQRRTANSALNATIKRSTLAQLSSLVQEIRSLIPDSMWEDLNKEFDSDAPLNWHEVDKLVGLGATIGSHADYHSILHKHEAPEEIDRQLTTSRNLILEHVGRCDFVAYPNGLAGDVCNESLAAAHRAGYTFGFSAFSGEITANCNRYLLPRFRAPSKVSILRAMLSSRFITNRRYQRWASTLVKPTDRSSGRSAPSVGWGEAK
jgi:peptidoglycan/xylan/chitin deacetylase (PgdA/CDA1 family)